MADYVSRIQEGIQKQKDLWALYKKHLPTSDMLPGEKKKRIAKCEEIIKEIHKVKHEVDESDRLWKEEQYRSIYEAAYRQAGGRPHAE